MKKIILSFVVASAMMASCNSTPGGKAQSLIEDNITESIANSDSYVAVDTKVDSAYAPLDNPELYKLFDKYVKATNDLMVHHKMITEMQTKMGKFTDMYSDSLIARLNPIIKSLESYVALMENMDRMMDMPREFVGYKVLHTYKTDIDGKSTEQKDMFMLNKDMSSVEHRMSFQNYVFVSEDLKKMQLSLKSDIEAYRNTIETARKLAE